MPKYEVELVYAIVAPANTPKAIIDKLNSQLISVLNNPEIKGQVSSKGFEVITSTPNQLSEYIKSEVAKWGPIVKNQALHQNKNLLYRKCSMIEISEKRLIGPIIRLHPNDNIVVARVDVGIGTDILGRWLVQTQEAFEWVCIRWHAHNRDQIPEILYCGCAPLCRTQCRYWQIQQ